MDFGLKGKNAIVTGAAGAIGGAIARDLAREGVNLSLCYHNQECNELVEETRSTQRGKACLHFPSCPLCPLCLIILL